MGVCGNTSTVISGPEIVEEESFVLAGEHGDGELCETPELPGNDSRDDRVCGWDVQPLLRASKRSLKICFKEPGGEESKTTQKCAPPQRVWMSGLRSHLLDEVHHWPGVQDDSLPSGQSVSQEVSSSVHIAKQSDVKVNLTGICSQSEKAPYQTFSPQSMVSLVGDAFLMRQAFAAGSECPSDPRLCAILAF